ncbi:DUF7344 domain-containing protein [Halomicrococcus gelatinilyticus]|uniref:DUF7344 domain-containing protein n=1 Tax=Halomicrococcus gelatinilyticus TaxID=1702103 RepID=UPI002E12D617
MSAASDSPQSQGMEDAGESVPALPRDKIFHILQTQRRRDALRYLKDNEGPVEMRTLAEQVAAWENDTTVAELSSDERQRVYIALYQSHLPKLAEEGIIEYEKGRGIVERGPVAEQFDPYLDAPEDDEGATEDEESGDEQASPWLDYYRRTTVVSAFVVLASWLGVPPATVLRTGEWGAVVVAAFALLSAAQVVFGDD